MKNILSVNELNTFIKYKLEADTNLENIYVTGEISNITFNRSGHVYFSLKDDLSSISCMTWRTHADKLRNIHAKDGMKITAIGKISYYVPYGKLSLEVRDVQIEGIGELQQIYEQRFNELKADGWFDESLKKPIPRYPQNIGIVTADTGAAVHDLITTITRRWPIANIYLFPSKVQGENASKNMAQKIVQANNFDKKIDVLIVGRGGGSYEDLWEFNEMPVLSAIRDSSIPIISAVGHEPDVTLADYVADKRAATPTAAGELATPSLYEIKQNLQHKYETLKSLISNIYQNRVESMNFANKNLVNKMDNIIQINNNHLVQYQSSLIQSIKRKIENNKTIINNNIRSIKWIIDKLIERSENSLNNAIKMLNIMNPQRPLDQGYALIKKDGKYLSKDALVKKDDNLTIERKLQSLDITVNNAVNKEKE